MGEKREPSQFKISIEFIVIGVNVVNLPRRVWYIFQLRRPTGFGDKNVIVE